MFINIASILPFMSGLLYLGTSEEIKTFVFGFFFLGPVYMIPVYRDVPVARDVFHPGFI